MPMPAIFIVPHTHFDPAVFLTREATLDLACDNLLAALDLMEKDETFTFVLDQVAYIKPFLERHPEAEATVRDFIAAGRLEITGGVYVMPDLNIPSGESLIRQIAVGKKYCRDVLGVDVNCGWMIDGFGHHPQIPQIMKKAGFDSYVFWRGAAPDARSEFIWQGLDATAITCHWLPRGYSSFWRTPAEYESFTAFADETYAYLKQPATTDNILSLCGRDLTAPKPFVPEFVRRFNEGQHAYRLSFSTPGRFFEALRGAAPELETVSGDLNPIFQGCYSSRIEIKQQNRQLENLLFTAEQLAAFSSLHGYSPADSEPAWEPVLFNQFHDIICGSHVDAVFENSMRRYREAGSLARAEIARAMNHMTDRIDTRGNGMPLVVYNQLSWTRTDVVECDVAFTAPDVFSLVLENSAHQRIPLQIVNDERYENDAFRKITIAFVAVNVPAMGYEVYHLIPGQDAGDDGNIEDDGEHFENEFYSLRVDPRRGLITSIKRDGTELVDPERPFANSIVREADHGDFWQVNDTVFTGGVHPDVKKYPLPAADAAVFSHDCTGNTSSRYGPVMTEFTTAFDRCHTSIRMYRGLPRIDITTSIVNNDEWVRYRAAFPTTIRDGRISNEIPFGAIERPEGEFPCQNWMDYTDGANGIGLINRGLPGNNVADGVMMLSLLRCVSLVEYENIGGYEEGVAVERSFEKNINHVFHYALLPHEGDWRKARVYRHGLAFNNPLLVRCPDAHAGELPACKSFLGISADNVVASMVKNADEHLVMRVYEAEGRPSSDVKLRLDWHADRVHETNLIGDDAREVRVGKNGITFDIGAFEIKTFRISRTGAE